MVIIEKLLEYLSFLGLSSANLSGLLLPTSGLAGPGWLFGALGTVAVSIFGISIGKTRAIMSLFSIYVTFVFDRLFPYFDKIQNIAGNSIEPYWIRAGIFILVYVAVFIIFNFSILRKRLSSTEFSLFGVVLLSLLQLGLLISILISFLPQELAEKWSFGFYNYFAVKPALFIWAISPLPVLLFFKQK